jgi:hypothetical protein
VVAESDRATQSMMDGVHIIGRKWEVAMSLVGRCGRP